MAAVVSFVEYDVDSPVMCESIKGFTSEEEISTRSKSNSTCSLNEDGNLKSILRNKGDTSGNSSDSESISSATDSIPEKFVEENPWLSVNDMLLRNRCWICKKIFHQRVRKTPFKVADLFWYFNDRLMSEKEGENLEPLRSENMHKCYEHYKNLMQENRIQEIFKNDDIQMWMTGLFCGISADCSKEAKYVVGEYEEDNGIICGQDPSTSTLTALTASEINARMRAASTATTVDGDAACPPNCGCENPWAFLNN